MASSNRTCTVSPTSLLASEPDYETRNLSSRALVNRQSTSIQSPTRTRKSQSFYTSIENTPPSFYSSEYNVMDEASIHELERRARKKTSQALLASTPESRELSRKKSKYYQEVFAYREPYTSARERVTRDAVVVAELKTNVILKDEYTLITDLSSHLADRYQRPEHSILVHVTHSSCLLLGGSFDPAYILIISALPSLIAPQMNKRNAFMTSEFLRTSLGVTQKRGVIKYAPAGEENLAYGGKTVLGEIEQLEKSTSEENDGGLIQRTMSRTKERQNRKRASMTMLSLPRSRKSQMPTPPIRKAVSPAGMPFNSLEDASSTITEKEEEREQKEEVDRPLEMYDEVVAMESAGIETGTGTGRVKPKMRARKSFMALFGK